jgi:hypothetical protein
LGLLTHIFHVLFSLSLLIGVKISRSAGVCLGRLGAAAVREADLFLLRGKSIFARIKVFLCGRTGGTGLTLHVFLSLSLSGFACGCLQLSLFCLY